MTHQTRVQRRAVAAQVRVVGDHGGDRGTGRVRNARAGVAIDDSVHRLAVLAFNCKAERHAQCKIRAIGVDCCVVHGLKLVPEVKSAISFHCRCHERSSYVETF